jgi:hypothetical protein
MTMKILPQSSHLEKVELCSMSYRTSRLAYDWKLSSGSEGSYVQAQHGLTTREWASP